MPEGKETIQPPQETVDEQALFVPLDNVDESEPETEIGIVEHEMIVLRPLDEDSDLPKSNWRRDVEHNPSVRTPLAPFELPGKDPKAHAAPVSIRTQPGQKPNELGVVYDKETDHCFHLNLWKRGVCVKQGNQPCPFLGGHQVECELFVDKAAAKANMPEDRRQRRY